MDALTRDRLLQLNRDFYQAFAAPFSATRQRLQPGVQHFLEGVPSTARILDLGCGNGEVWHHLQQRQHLGTYTGLDFSSGLLSLADQRAPGHPAQATFIQADLSAPGWADTINPILAPFDFILAFAVLHHIPDLSLRRQILREVPRLLAPGGLFIHSQWQFLNSPRLRQRIQPWETIGLSPEQVDAGDFLMDWRSGGAGLRYVHHFTPEELGELANDCGFWIQETLLSDGSNGKLGLYQVWKLNI